MVVVTANMASSSLTMKDRAVIRVAKAKLAVIMKKISAQLSLIRRDVQRLARERKFMEIEEQNKRLQTLGIQYNRYRRLLTSLEDKTGQVELSELYGVLGKLQNTGDDQILQYIQVDEGASVYMSDRERSELPVKLEDCMDDNEYREYLLSCKAMQAPPPSSLIDF